MAKKKKKKKSVDPRVTSRSERGGEFDSDTLRGYVETLKECGAELGALAKIMDNSELDIVKVDGRTKVDRAVKLIREFSVNCEFAIKRAMILQKE